MYKQLTSEQRYTDRAQYKYAVYEKTQKRGKMPSMQRKLT